MSFCIVIPARYASSRLPGKPLRPIAGKPMIQHVYECAMAAGAREVVVATDDERIRDVARGFGALVCMTSPDHPSGTDRLAEVVRRRDYADSEIIVNVQGDEPLMPRALIRQVAGNLAARERASIATLCARISTTAELFDPHVVKVVCDKEGYALYFSRACIPWDRDAFAVTTAELPPRSRHYRHIGLYAYRASFLREYAGWRPCMPEQAEALEQLRALWHGHRIHVAEAVEKSGADVNTEADIERVERLLAERAADVY